MMGSIYLLLTGPVVNSTISSDKYTDFWLFEAVFYVQKAGLRINAHVAQ